MDDLQQKTAEMARMMNYKLHAESLNVPLKWTKNLKFKKV